MLCYFFLNRLLIKHPHVSSAPLVGSWALITPDEKHGELLRAHFQPCVSWLKFHIISNDSANRWIGLFFHLQRGGGGTHLAVKRLRPLLIFSKQNVKYIISQNISVWIKYKSRRDKHFQSDKTDSWWWKSNVKTSFFVVWVMRVSYLCVVDVGF